MAITARAIPDQLNGVNFSLNNGSVLFLNKRFFNLNLILKSKIYFYKYYFGIVRLTKRILAV